MSKKDNIIKAATQLFATQGFDGTTTKQIAEKAGATEPLLYYHFTGKDEIYTSILISVHEEYFSHLKTLQGGTDTQFERIENLFKLHFQLISQNPDEMVLMVTSRPAKLNDPENVCSKNAQSRIKRLRYYLSNCLKKGIKSNEFNKLRTKETTDTLMILIDGILQQGAKAKKKLVDSIVSLLQKSLVAK